MRWALERCGVEYESTNDWPHIGLALVQFRGPWTETKRFQEAAKKRHWVAVSNGNIYDVNAHAWLPLTQWESRIMPLLIAARPATTGWQLAKSYEVKPSLRYLPEFPVVERNEPLRGCSAH